MAGGMQRCRGTRLDGVRCTRTWSRANNPGKYYCHDHPGGGERPRPSGQTSSYYIPPPRIPAPSNVRPGGSGGAPLVPASRGEPPDGWSAKPERRVASSRGAKRKGGTGRLHVPDAAVDIAIDALDSGWKSAVAGQLAKSLNDELWEAFYKKSGSLVFCHNLAMTARGLDVAAEAPKRLAGKIADQALKFAGRSSLERRVGIRIAEVVADQTLSGYVPKEALQASARALRICGIWLCVDGGWPLRACECFKDLASGKTEEVIKGQLEARLDVVVTHAGRRPA